MPSFMNSDEEKLYRPQREFSRVDAYLPVKIASVAEEERPRVRSRIAFESVLTEHPEMPEPDDKVIAECLHILNAKLDTIIRMLALPGRDVNGLDLQLVNISGGGLSTFTGEVFQAGELVEVRLMLPSTPLNVFYVYGSVVKCEAVPEKFKTCIEFTVIDEDIREQIAKYVFEKQREILRKKRRP